MDLRSAMHMLIDPVQLCLLLYNQLLHAWYILLDRQKHKIDTWIKMPSLRITDFYPLLLAVIFITLDSDAPTAEDYEFIEDLYTLVHVVQVYCNSGNS
jgi:hypothetical protein